MLLQNQDAWISADEAVKFGLADQIIKTKKTKFKVD
jgi:ATP-dependent protease ClpP protease subunit